MGTRGSAYFEIAESNDVDLVGKIGIRWDAYPEGFGYNVCEVLAGVYVGKPPQESADAKSFKNIERVILDLLDFPSDFLEDEYVYRFTFTPPKDACNYLVEDIVTVEVKHYKETLFTGSFKEFKKLCDYEGEAREDV